MTINTQSYAQVPPCVDSQGHNYQAYYPPPNMFGTVQIICTRCGDRRAAR